MSVYSLLANAISDRDGSRGREQGFKFLFTCGDLSQMANQESFLRANGFEVGRCNVYPAVKTEEEFKRALKLMWEKRADGWWNYGYKFVEYSICTQEEFDAALQRL